MAAQNVDIKKDDESLLVQDVIDDEYSSNFFNFTANDVHNGVMTSIVPEAISESTTRLKKCLLQKCKGYSEEIESACAALLTESLAGIPGIAKPLKDLTDAHFKIPKDVLLEQDLVQSVQYDDEDVKKMDMQKADLEDRIRRATFMEAYLEEELALMAQFSDSETITEGTDTAESTAEFVSLNSSVPPLSMLPKYVAKLDNASKKSKLIESVETPETVLQRIEEKRHRGVYETPS